MSRQPSTRDEGLTPIFDDLNLDLFVKVLSHTLFSPFFIAFIPLLNFARGSRWDDSAVRWPVYWWAGISLFQILAFSGKVYRSRGSWLLKPARLDWGEQLVLITGGAGGVGLLLANTLAVRNVGVVVLDVKEEIESENYNISYYKCDVSDPEAVEAVAARIHKEIGHPTILIQCAALSSPSPILSQPPADLSKTFAVNTLSQFYILRSFLPHLIEKKEGHVVSIGSILGQQGVAHLSAYCATKAALVALHRSLRRELLTHYKTPNIRTTLLLPGLIQTPLFASLHLPPNKLRDFVAPPLAAHTVVKEIIRSLDEREEGEVYMPFYAGCVGVLEWAPVWVRDWVQGWTGADWGMNSVEAEGEKMEKEAPRPAQVDA